ncbi:MAG: 30S ribosomal protein S27e [Candidatus Aenigmarchaeota archaeon]|nr:30S ribosomal protein S27e [Candidatus Aenigmarchaeota archaeon]
MRETIDMPKSKFVRVICKKCKNEQTVFNKASTLVKCLKCDVDLVIPTGGEVFVNGKVAQVLQ